MKYLDIPVQHCSGKILKAMRRGGDAASLRVLFAKLRERIPGITLRTTLMTGFPGETEEDFAELSAFVEEMRFDRMGCFSYSEEEQTVAASMPDMVEEAVRIHRAEMLTEQQMTISYALNEQRMETVTEAVIEGYDKWAECWFGRTAADAPDIDGKLFIAGTPADGYRVGQYVKVEITDMLDFDLIGEVVADESAK